MYMTIFWAGIGQTLYCIWLRMDEIPMTRRMFQFLEWCCRWCFIFWFLGFQTLLSIWGVGTQKRSIRHYCSLCPLWTSADMNRRSRWTCRLWTFSHGPLDWTFPLSESVKLTWEDTGFLFPWFEVHWKSSIQKSVSHRAYSFVVSMRDQWSSFGTSQQDS